MSIAAVLLEDLHVTYGTTWALAGLDIEAGTDTTLGVLGHNGAGKTTLIRVLTTLVRPTAGRVQVAGLDVVTAAVQLRRRIGVPASTPASTSSSRPARTSSRSAALRGFARRPGAGQAN
jgi:ABC-2 type transport system ATP-binding protein